MQSVLQYAILSWGGTTNNHIKRLHTIQKLILKIITNKSRYYPSEKLFVDSQILNVKQLYIMSITVHLLKNPDSLLIPNHVYETRHKCLNQVNLLKHKKQKYECYYFSLVPKINKLFLNFVNSNHLNINKLYFKKHIKKWIHSLNNIDINNILS